MHYKNRIEKHIQSRSIFFRTLPFGMINQKELMSSVQICIGTMKQLSNN